MVGAPGKVMPVMSSAGRPVPYSSTSLARYQTLGTRKPRCMSLATTAAPVELSAPLMAKPLLPGMAGSISPTPATGAAALLNPLDGISGVGRLEPSSGASQDVPSGNKKSARG